MTCSPRLLCLGLLCGFLLGLLGALPSSAADIYTFTRSTDDGLRTEVTTGKITVDGQSYRLELGPPGDEPRPWDVLLSRDGGAHEQALNLELETYFDLAAPQSRSVGPSRRVSLSKERVELVEHPQQEELSGLPVEKRELRLTYSMTVTFGGETSTTDFEWTAVFWTTTALPLALLPPYLEPRLPDLSTDFPALDRQLDEATAKVTGFPVKYEIHSRRTMPHTPPDTRDTVVTLGRFAKAPAQAELFMVPKGFRYQEPEVSGAVRIPGQKLFPDPPR